MGFAVRLSASCTPGNMSVETHLHITGRPGYGCCVRWKEGAPDQTEAATHARSVAESAFLSTAPCGRREVVWTRTEAAARARSDADYALLSTAPCRRREAVWTRTEAAARARLDADYAFLSTAPGRRREVVWTRTEAAARARLDADFAFLSTAPGRRREVVWTRTEAAAWTRSDVDFAFLSTAPGRRREAVWTLARTWTCAWAGLTAGQNGDSRRTSPPPPDIILSLPSPSPQPPLHAHRLTSRGMMMGLPVKGHPPRRVHQLPVAKGTGTTVAAGPTWQRTLPAPSGIASPLDPPRRFVTRRGRVYLVGGDTVEVVARTPVLAPPDPTNIPSPPSLLPFPPTHHSHRHSTSSLLFSSPSFPPFPLPSLPVPCLLSLTPPEAKQRPVIAPRNT